MVSPTCELSYLVWLTQRTTNTHGILKLKFQVPWITQFPDQTRNCQLTIRFEGPCIIFCNIYTFQQDTQCCSTDCLLMHRCQLYMFWTVTVHPQELLFRCCMCRLRYVLIRPAGTRFEEELFLKRCTSGTYQVVRFLRHTIVCTYSI